MPMKCVVCGQLTDAEARAIAAETDVASLKGSLASANDKALMRGRAAHEAQEKLRAAESALAEALAESEERGGAANALTLDLRAWTARATAAEARAIARDAEWRAAVKVSRHGITHWVGCPCAALNELVEGRGSSTDRAPGRNPGDAGSSPAPSTPDEEK